jgi:glycerate 2-kinase
MEKKNNSLIKNRDSLLSHGKKELREYVLDIAEAGISGGDPGHGTYKMVKCSETSLCIGDRCIDLNEVNHVYVVGMGKGAFPIAEALESILGDRLFSGLVVVKKGEKRRLKRITITEGGHPIPDENSVAGARKILEIADQAGPKDLVFVAVTGGASALATVCPDGITLADIQKTNELLLNSGAPIRHMNTVRKHLCLLKGGRLVSRIQPAEAITLTLDTRPKGMLWPDVSLPDETTFQDAIEVLNFYDLWAAAPDAVKSYLTEGTRHPELETLKRLEGIKSSIFYVGSPLGVLSSAAKRAEDLGYRAHILATNIHGESLSSGICLAGIANEVLLRNRPFPAPCALLSGGETTTVVNANCGIGGPNQEFILGFAGEVEEADNMAAIALDTDGTDGPTQIAGGIIDGETLRRAKILGIDIKKYLKNHDSSTALSLLDDAILTGNTGTNMKNLRIILIGR